MEFQSGRPEGEEEYFGPSLPPCLMQVVSNVISPPLPKELEEKYKLTVQEDEEVEEFVKQIKAELPPEDNNSDEEVYGPMPCRNMELSKHQLLLEEIEKRASKTKEFLLKSGQNNEAPLQRDAWMTELPPQLTTNYGVANRRFKMSSTTAKDSDRSVWTDTPADRERKLKSGKKVKEEANCPEDEILKMKDEQQRKAVEEYDKKHKRTESLLKMHEKKLKKKKRKHSSSSSSSSDSDDGRGKHKKKHKKEKKKKDKKKDEKKSTSSLPERRPFDRDVDLGVSRVMDGSQRRSLVQKSHELNSKFSHGKSHYL